MPRLKQRAQLGLIFNGQPPQESVVGKKNSSELQVIRPELNIERWPIFIPSKASNKKIAVTRVFQQEFPLANGGKQIGTVTKVPTAYGDLTTEDLLVYYALITIWYEENRPLDNVHISLRRIAKLLGKDWGQNVAEALKTSLYRLRLTYFIWENSFCDAAKQEQQRWVSLGKNGTFSILEDLHIHETKQGGHVTGEASSFKFHARILDNLLRNYTRPVLLSTLLTLNSDIGKLLYRYIDRMMAYKECYERRSQDLFEDLGLEGKTYAYRSKRKEKLLDVLKELQGVPLTTGILIRAEMQETDDGQDFKVVFTKQPQNMLGNPNSQKEPDVQGAVSETPHTAEELVRYFHQRLGRTACHPSQKELRQAADLLAAYGWECALAIVKYAIQAATATNFAMRWFGAILQYQQEAVEAFQRAQAAATSSADDQHEFGVENSFDEEQRVERERAFEALDDATKARLFARIEISLADRKAHMTSNAYQATVAILMKQAFWEEFYAADHTVSAQ